jgi:polar amino acid transport system substrate-binding protein
VTGVGSTHGFKALENTMSIPARKRTQTGTDKRTDCQPERALRESERGVKLELAYPPADAKTGHLELADLIDAKMVQSLVDDFYALVHFPMSIVDIQGNVLVGVGWQDICTKFHRANPETCKSCIERDTQLSTGIPPGEYRLYKCKNNMWHGATPLMVGGLHVGNLFSGQFFFDDERLDGDLFRAQARQYGFDVEKQLAALETAPRLSRQYVTAGMAFLRKLAQMLSQMSYSNIELTRSLAERKRSQEALIRREKLASAGRMAATVAHEINNPLEAAINCIYLATTNPKLTPELKKYLEIADRELQRVAHIARQTLGFYCEDAKPAIIDIRTLVDEVVKLYSSKLTAKQIRLWVQHDGFCEETIGVAGEIRQVISHLLTNAIDASRPKGSVKIRTRRVRLNGCNYTRVTVADAGTGMSAANRSQLFEPFFTTKEAVGTGLGLWLSRKIITKHNGLIRVRSVEGKGTMFSVFLPDAP